MIPTGRTQVLAIAGTMILSLGCNKYDEELAALCSTPDKQGVESYRDLELSRLDGDYDDSDVIAIVEELGTLPPLDRASRVEAASAAIGAQCAGAKRLRTLIRETYLVDGALFAVNSRNISIYSAVGERLVLAETPESWRQVLSTQERSVEIASVDAGLYVYSYSEELGPLFLSAEKMTLEQLPAEANGKRCSWGGCATDSSGAIDGQGRYKLEIVRPDFDTSYRVTDYRVLEISSGRTVAEGRGKGSLSYFHSVRTAAGAGRWLVHAGSCTECDDQGIQVEAILQGSRLVLNPVGDALAEWFVKRGQHLDSQSLREAPPGVRVQVSRKGEIFLLSDGVERKLEISGDVAPCDDIYRRYGSQVQWLPGGVWAWLIAQENVCLDEAGESYSHTSPPMVVSSTTGEVTEAGRFAEVVQGVHPRLPIYRVVEKYEKHLTRALLTASGQLVTMEPKTLTAWPSDGALAKRPAKVANETPASTYDVGAPAVDTTKTTKSILKPLQDLCAYPDKTVKQCRWFHATVGSADIPQNQRADHAQGFELCKPVIAACGMGY